MTVGKDRLSSQRTELNEDGIPVVSHPDETQTWKKWIVNQILFYVVFQSILPIFLLTKLWTLGFKDSWELITSLYTTVSEAHASPIASLPYYQDKKLLQKIWKQPSAIPYISQNALEYQKREGYCGRSTLRNILKSYPSFPQDLVPVPSGGPTEPKKWIKVLHELLQKGDETKKNHNIQIETKIIEGSIPYERFVNAIRNALRDPSSRLAINYLRPALTGWKTPKWIPIHLFLGLMGGHFSFIIGILEKNDVDISKSQDCNDDDHYPLVAVFDVNHAYGGAYLVPAKRLHESVKAHDMSTFESRALVELRINDIGDATLESSKSK